MSVENAKKPLVLRTLKFILEKNFVYYQEWVQMECNWADGVRDFISLTPTSLLPWLLKERKNSVGKRINSNKFTWNEWMGIENGGRRVQRFKLRWSKRGGLAAPGDRASVCVCVWREGGVGVWSAVRWVSGGREILRSCPEKKMIHKWKHI